MNIPPIHIHFWGGTGTVTGSKYLIETQQKKILVDCGLFQGLKELRNLNWNTLPIDASEIDAVLITHGHLDHTGYLPLLVRQGYTGSIYATAPTVEIATIIMNDCAKIQVEDAARANKHGYSKHSPALPLYDMDDVERTLPHLHTLPLNEWTTLGEGITFRFRYSSHILGATFIELNVHGKLLVFSGDVGRDNDPLMYPSEKPERADVLFIESTYGGKIHPAHAEEQLADAINAAAKRHGTIIIPSFAVERTQLLMFLLWKLQEKGTIPQIPIYMDSPMGTHVLEVFQRHPDWHKLAPAQCIEMCRDIKRIREPEETLQLAMNKQPKIIIAGSGMATGGRVLMYFEHYLDDPSATILLAGFQAEGTRGRLLLDGAHEIKMAGKLWRVRAAVTQVEGLSAHADQQGLLHWMSALQAAPEHIFITHGEQDASRALKKKIHEVYGWESTIPKLLESLTLH